MNEMYDDCPQKYKLHLNCYFCNKVSDFEDYDLVDVHIKAFAAGWMCPIDLPSICPDCLHLFYRKINEELKQSKMEE